jgi:hypothetical protein
MASFLLFFLLYHSATIGAKNGFHPDFPQVA